MPILTFIVRTFLDAGGTIAPGFDLQPIATLGLGDFRWDNDGVLKFDLMGAGSADKLTLAGFGKGTAGSEGFRFDFSGSTPMDGGQYLLATFNATDFNVVDFSYFGFTSDASGVFELQSGVLYFHTTVVPEPRALILLVTGLCARLGNRCLARA